MMRSLETKRDLLSLAIEDTGSEDVQAMFGVVAGDETIFTLAQILLSHESLGSALMALAMDKVLRDGAGN